MSEWKDFLERARKSAKPTTLPPVWKPQNVGDEIFGIVKDIMPNPWDDSVNTYVIETKDGDEYMTPRNEALVNEFERLKPGIGDKIYIRYDGVGRSKPGRNPPKLFSVYVEKATRIEPETPKPEPPKISIAEEVKEEEKPATPSEEVEKLRKYLVTLKTIYMMPLSWEKLQKQLEAKGIYMSLNEVKKLPEAFPDILEPTEDGKKVRFKK